MPYNDNILSDTDRTKLDNIVTEMVNNKEPDANIQAVVDDFKTKYSVKKKEPTVSNGQGSVGTDQNIPQESVSDFKAETNIKEQKISLDNKPLVTGNLIDKPSNIFQQNKFADLEYGLVKESEKRLKYNKTPIADFDYDRNTLTRMASGFANGVASLPKTVVNALDYIDDLIEPVAEEVVKLPFQPINALFPGSKYQERIKRQAVDGKLFDKDPIDKIKDTDWYKDYTDNLKTHAQEIMGDESIAEQWRSGDIKGAVNQALTRASQSLPLTLTALFGGSAGLTAIGLGSAGEKYDELKDSELPQSKILLNSTIHGNLEMLTETVTQGYGSMLGKIYMREGKEAGTKLIAKGLKGWFEKPLKQLGIYGAPIGEGLSEGVNGISQYLSDVAFGVEDYDSQKLKDTFINDFTVGATMGTTFTLAGASGKLMKPRSQVTQENNTIKKGIQVDKPKEEREDYLNGILKDVPTEYKEPARKQITELLVKKDELQYKADHASDKLKPVWEKQVKAIDNAIADVIDIEEGFVQDEKKGDQLKQLETKKEKPPVVEQTIADTASENEVGVSKIPDNVIETSEGLFELNPDQVSQRDEMVKKYGKERADELIKDFIDVNDLRKYNIEPSEVKKQKIGKPDEVLSELRNLGYSDADITKMSAPEELNIVKNKITNAKEQKTETGKVLEGETGRVQEPVKEPAKEIIKFNDVKILRDANSKEEIENALNIATGNDNIQDSLNSAESIINKGLYKAVYYSNPKKFANELADKIESIINNKPQENATETENVPETPSVEEIRDNGIPGGEEINLGEQGNAETPPQEGEISIERKEAAKKKISDGLDGLLSKWGTKQNLLPEERTSLITDLSNIASGITDLTAIEIQDFIREKIQPLIAKLGLSDKDVEDIIKESVKEPENTGVRMKSTQATRKEFGLEEYEGTKTPTDVQLTINAEDAIKKGYNVENLISRMEERELPTALEQRILRQYLAGIEKQFENNPNDETLGKIKRAIEASDVAGTLLSESFRSRRGEQIRDDSLAGFFIEDMETLGVDKLTDQQKDQIKKEWEEISELKQKYEDKIKELEAKEAKAKADKEFKKQKSQTSKNTKKSKEDFIFERKQIIDSLKNNWKKASNDNTLSALPLPYAKQLAYITPDVAKLMKSYIEEGIQNLDEMIQKIHSDLKPIIPELEEKDVHNLIAGEYNKPQRTKNEILEKVTDLRLQAKLINKLENIEKGEVPKNEKAKIARNKEITDLRKQIKEHPNTKLENAKNRMRLELSKLEEDLKTGNFLKERPKPIQLDKEGIDIKDKLIRARQERQVRILQQKYENRSDYEKKKDIVIKILNTPRTLMASGDLSAVLRQGLIPTISNPRMAVSAFKEMITQMKSQKAFDRWLYDVYNSPDYLIIKESGLYVSDPSNLNLSAKEEQFMGSYAEDVPVIGAIIKGSERAYIAYLNKLRVDMFRNMISGYEAHGKTIDNSKYLYKETAKYINNITGRGHFGKFEESAKILNTAFFSPRLIASRFTLLTNPVNPKFWIETPKEVRNKYLVDMAKFIGAGMTALLLAKMAGGDVEDDPRSTDFGKIKFGNQRYDIWGGFQSYVRLFGQLITGETKSSSTGAIYKLGTKFGQQNRLELLTRFARGKLAPVPASAVNFISGEDIMGDPTTLKNEVVKSIFPLIVSDVSSAIKEKGTVIGVLSTFPFATLGIGTQNYPSAGSYPTETTKINGKKVNALGETKENINQNAWTILNKYGFNIQPKPKRDLTVSGKEYSDEQYLTYITERGKILKEELVKYEDPDLEDMKNSVIEELGYNEEEALKTAENLITKTRVKFLTNAKKEADTKAKEIATGLKSRRKKSLEEQINE